MTIAEGFVLKECLLVDGPIHHCSHINPKPVKTGNIDPLERRDWGLGLKESVFTSLKQPDSTVN
jgi:hypothetical protein